MVRKILCKNCEASSKKLFPNESPYPGEHVKFVPGEAKHGMLCDDCGVYINGSDTVCAFSIFTDYGGIPYYRWEEEYLTFPTVDEQVIDIMKDVFNITLEEDEKI